MTQYCMIIEHWSRSQLAEVYYIELCVSRLARLFFCFSCLSRSRSTAAVQPLLKLLSCSDFAQSVGEMHSVNLTRRDLGSILCFEILSWTQGEVLVGR